MSKGNIISKDNRLALTHLYVGFGAFLVGALCGLIQGLERAGLLQLPSWLNYYQILTAHGVLLALVFTTYFIFGFFFAGSTKTMGAMNSGTLKIGWLGFWILLIGTLMAAAMIITNDASVLFTFYVPLQASPIFYIGLALFVVGTLVSGVAIFKHYIGWRRANKGKLSPLFGYMATATLILWFIATIGVVGTVVFQMIPWSLGLVDTINIQLSRTLFWAFGHPLVYFWLLPAYMVWYVSIPKIIGGKLFSDALARLSFVLFILFSFPVGMHHQLMEPGLSEGWKFLQVILTFAVVVPTLMTAFSIFATFESTGREKGAKGVFGWFKKLPYGDVRFLAPFLGMLFFIPGGIGGLVNASHQMNAMVHNTLFIVGHFHVTVGAPVALTFFGVAYWLIPYLTGRKLTPAMNKYGVIQTIFWSVGMFIMSTAQHILGLFGAPRRTAHTTYMDHPDALVWFDGILSNQVTMAIGGTLLFVSALMLVYAVIHLGFVAPRSTETDKTDFPITEVADGAGNTPKILERWRVWIIICFALILIAYVIPIWDLIQNAAPGSKGFRTW